VSLTVLLEAETEIIKKKDKLIERQRRTIKQLVRIRFIVFAFN